jgi:hypothetical protein
METFDLSLIPPLNRRKALLHATNLHINRKHLRFVLASRALWTGLAKALPPVKALQRAVYEHCYTKLDEASLPLNVCGWTEMGGKMQCRRAERQCCLYEYPCEYLDYGGCPVRSLACKMWLCPPAVKYLRETASDSGNPLSKDAKRLIALRRRYDFIIRCLAVPMRGRCSAEDAFSGEVDFEMNTDEKDWFDGELIREKWLFGASGASNA